MPRTPIQFRISATGRAVLETHARDHDVTIADVMRACLIVAFHHQDELADTLRTAHL